MRPSLRKALALVGVALILFALAALSYAARPTRSQREQFQPAPTLFVPPESFLEWQRWSVGAGGAGT
ncbi:MAG: hypothetical protein H0T73_17040 [Ardenticatenales bacterium]|nr:hypothetical protein [Ardenticatenales bacterium]